jgi:16S rRNA (guanine966-N2)-methyltransferase
MGCWAMRVVGGSAKGHRLLAPRGSETRPTSDKVRESIFNIVRDSFVDGTVLDLFAGTGALGIEALSRGAEHAIFVERRSAACDVIRRNLAHTKFDTRAVTICKPVERALPELDSTCSLVLLDPPYAYPGIHDIMTMVGGARVIEDDSIVVLEHSPRFAVAERYGRIALLRQRVYGDTAVSIFDIREEVIS